MADDFNLEDSTLTAVLDDFTERTEAAYTFVLSPIDDGLGWTAAVVTADGSSKLAQGAAKSPIVALCRVAARALDAYNEIMEEALEGVDVDDD